MSTYSRKTMSDPSTVALTEGICSRALAAALRKTDWKPSLMPCADSNISLYSFRNAMRLLMSISWNVDRAACVFCAFLRFLAMAWRMRGILILRSGRAPAAGAAAASRTAGADAGAAAFGAGGAGADGVGAG